MAGALARSFLVNSAHKHLPLVYVTCNRFYSSPPPRPDIKPGNFFFETLYFTKKNIYMKNFNIKNKDNKISQVFLVFVHHLFCVLVLTQFNPLSPCNP